MASIRPRGNGYQASFYDRTGRQHRKQFKLKRDAQRWIDEQTTATLSGVWVEPQAGRIRFKDYADRWLANRLVADTTHDQYERFVRLHSKPLHNLRLEAISRDDVQALVNEWNTSSAATTVNTRYLILSIVMRAAVRDRLIGASPCESISLPRLPPAAALVPIDTDTVAALTEALDPRYRLFAVLGASTGVRRGELLGLTKDRIAPAFGRIRVDRQLTRASTSATPVWGPPKTDASTRNVDAADYVFDAIDEHVVRFGTHPSGLILTNTLGCVLVPATMHRAWKLAVKKIEAPEVTPHDLRHYFASMQIAGGTSIKKLQEQLGHKSATETWDTYGHLVGDEDERVRSVMASTLGRALAKVSGTPQAQEGRK